MTKRSPWLVLEPELPRAPAADQAAEPLLRIDQIQGHVLPGFARDFVAFTFFSIDAPDAFREFLAATVPAVTTMAEVLAAQGMNAGGPVAAAPAWTALAFTANGLALLRGDTAAGLGFADEAFVAGLHARSRMGLLGDPRDTGREGDPDRWLFGRPALSVHGVAIHAAEDEETIARAVSAWDAAAGEAARVVFRQMSAHLPGDRHGQEHFGFLDDISQPGIRGEIRSDVPLTARENPHDRHQGKPGQDLVWPGEFVFGYPGQSAAVPFHLPGDDPMESPARAAPAWARDGSFLVVRRLRQDVGGFHRFVRDSAGAAGVAPDFLASRLMGRWPSGCPTVMSPDHDRPEVGGDAETRNAFEYQSDRFSVPEGGAGALPNDPDGLVCPFSSHIRKAFPRNDRSRELAFLDRSWTHTRRMVRRGIPYGPGSASRFDAPLDDGVDRGLMFLCHVTSIRDQFEFVSKRMINDHNFSLAGQGYDPIVGQNDTLPNRFRAFKVPLGGSVRTLSTMMDWVIPTGGDYFFMPSLDCLTDLARGPDRR